jgi:hypothetical protein
MEGRTVESVGEDVTHVESGDFVILNWGAARRFMVEQNWELVVDAALAISQIGVAHLTSDFSITTSVDSGSGMTTSTTSTGSPVLS